MASDRREFLKSFAAAATLTVIPATANADEKREAAPDAVGMLYDTTLCIGCKACVVKCKEIGGLPPDVDGYGEGLYDAPEDLNEYTRNIIKLYKGGGGDDYSYVKQQCMHCIDPACVNACMLGALHKTKFGVVAYEQTRCVGCRYCQIACPFNIPKFEWSRKDAKIVKCDFCIDRLLEGREPGCTEVCPRDAVIFGKRADLLEEARRRLRENPDRYVQNIYGETELGGTQVLYLSHVPFENLGFRFSQDESVPARQRGIQHGIYQGFAAPIALYAVLGAVIFRNRKKKPFDEPAETDESEGGRHE